jgi:hypothetical protein
MPMKIFSKFWYVPNSKYNYFQIKKNKKKYISSTNNDPRSPRIKRTPI